MFGFVLVMIFPRLEDMIEQILTVVCRDICMKRNLVILMKRLWLHHLTSVCVESQGPRVVHFRCY